MLGIDPAYQARTVPRWSRSAGGGLLGSVLCSMGVLSLVFSVTNLCKGRVVDTLAADRKYHQTDGSLLIPRTWTENPFWPAAGKGFWVGLLLMAAGIMGMLSWRDGTLAALKAFIVLSALASIFSFYQMITAIIPLLAYNLHNLTNTFNVRNNYENTEYVFNALLLSTGLIGSVLGFLAMVIGLVAAGYCSNGRTRVAARPRVPVVGFPVRGPIIPGPIGPFF